MAPIRASVHPVTSRGLEDFKDLALPLDVHVEGHDENEWDTHGLLPLLELLLVVLLPQLLLI